jgi:hypothetical protein
VQEKLQITCIDIQKASFVVFISIIIAFILGFVSGMMMTKTTVDETEYYDAIIPIDIPIGKLSKETAEFFKNGHTEPYTNKF